MIVRVSQKKRHPERLEIEADVRNQDGIRGHFNRRTPTLAANGRAQTFDRLVPNPEGFGQSMFQNISLRIECFLGNPCGAISGPHMSKRRCLLSVKE
jgi:hypothetical protein